MQALVRSRLPLDERGAEESARMQFKEIERLDNAEPLRWGSRGAGQQAALKINPLVLK